jgi:chemotaxis protein CheX
MQDVTRSMLDATRELFHSMLRLPATEDGSSELTHALDSIEVVAIVGLSGSRAGALAVYAPGTLARRMAGGLLGTVPTEVDDEVRDAFGEAANIIAGNVAVAFGHVGETIQLSLPSVIVGQGLVTSILNTTPPRRAHRFVVDGEHFHVELALGECEA